MGANGTTRRPPPSRSSEEDTNLPPFYTPHPIDHLLEAGPVIEDLDLDHFPRPSWARDSDEESTIPDDPWTSHPAL